MNTIKFSAVALAVAALGTSAMAQNGVGNWTGHIAMKTPPMPANVPPQQKAMLEQQMAMLGKITLALTLKKDMSYSIATKGLPKQAPGKAGETQTGTWTLKGKTLTLIPSKKPTRPGAPSSMTGTFSANGKTFVVVPPGGRGGSMTITFTKS